MADEDNTVVTLNEGGTETVFNLNAGEFVIQENSNSVNQLSTITSNKPILVGQFMVGSSQTGQFGLGDPAYSLVPDVDQWLDAYIFNVPVGYQNDFLNIASTQSGINSLLLDGASVDSSLFSSISGTNFFGGLIDIADGSHVIEADAPFMLLGHGFDTNFASYFGVGGSKSSGGGVEPPPIDPPNPIEAPEPGSLIGLGLITGLGLFLKKKSHN
jgi:hypothetical protein